MFRVYIKINGNTVDVTEPVSDNFVSSVRPSTELSVACSHDLSTGPIEHVANDTVNGTQHCLPTRPCNSKY